MRNSTIGSQVKILSFGFLFIFFGFNGAQQYVTSFFSEAGMVDVGFHSLILIYLFFIVFDPFSAVFVSKYGAKKCMIFGAFFYSLFIFLLLSASVVLIYIGSSLLGIAASLLWTGQNSYLIRASGKKSYGANAGFFNSLQSMGSAFGVFILGFLIAAFLFRMPFLLFSVFPLFGVLILLTLQDFRGEQSVDHFKLVKKSIMSPTALKLSSVYFAVNFIFGLMIGIIPVQIKNVLGVSYIGILTSLFFILPILLSYFFGKLSDIKGRKAMIVVSYILLIIALVLLSFPEKGFLLALGIFLLALNWAIAKPITYALVGDVSTEENLEFLTALFWMAQGVGIISALLLSQALQGNNIMLYLISIFVVIISFIVLFPVLNLRIEKIREKITEEVS